MNIGTPDINTKPSWDEQRAEYDLRIREAVRRTADDKMVHLLTKQEQEEIAFKKLAASNVLQPAAVNDTGESLVTHPTGAIRSGDVDDIRMDLVPPLALEAVARVLAKGAVTHGEHNWRKGTKWSLNINHAINHINKFQRGDRSVDHISHAICNLLFLKEYQTIYPQGNDLLTAADFQDPRQPGDE